MRDAPALPLVVPLVVTLVAALGLSGCLQFQKRPLSLAPPDRYVKVGRDRMYVEEHRPPTQPRAPRAPTVVLVHGFGATGRSWFKVQPALVRNYHVLIVDLPGFGRSDKYPGDYSMDAIARKLLRVLDAKGVKRAHLVGHSWGTAICLATALRAPQRVQSLTLISSFAYEAQLPPTLIWARAPVLGELIFGLLWDARLDDRMNYSFYDSARHIHPAGVDAARKLLSLPGAMAASLAAVRGMHFGRMQTRYGEIQQPVLIISGRDDRLTRLPAARRLANDLPNAQHLVIPQCGHIPLIEQPAKVVQAMDRFIRDRHAAPHAACSHPPKALELAVSGGPR